MKTLKEIFSSKRLKQILIIIVAIALSIVIICAAWKQDLFNKSQNNGEVKTNAPAAAQAITTKVVAKSLAGNGGSNAYGSNGSVVEAARALAELTGVNGPEATYYGTPRTSSSGFHTGAFVCASFVAEVIYNVTGGAVYAKDCNTVDTVAQYFINSGQFELVYYHPVVISVGDISGAVNNDKNPADLVQPGDVVGTFGDYTFQHVYIYLGNGEVADQGGTGGDYASTGQRNGFSDTKYILRLKNQGSQSSGTQVADLNKINSLIRVVANGSSAKVTLEEKSGSSWKTVLSTNGYVGSAGVGKGSESDSRTPAGAYSLGIGFGANTANPGTSLTWKKITSSNWVWVDDPNSKYYNQLVDTSKVGSQKGEVLVNYTTAYKYAIAINYNTSPVVPGAGSAIFLHCIGNGPTAGCVAVPEKDMITILQKVKSSTMIVIGTQNGEYAIDKYISK